MQETFRTIYQNNLWESLETKSGIGSEVAHTHEIRKQLALLFKDLNIKSFLDAPCGDFNWMKELDLTGIHYRGADILPEIIEENTAKYAQRAKAFTLLDITQDALPLADLLLVRDCLVHFSYPDISRFLANLHRSSLTFLVTTTFPERKDNWDITTGDWRPLNLDLAPFSFPKPLRLINEKFKAYEGNFPDKSLAVYRVQDLPSSLSADFYQESPEVPSPSKIGRHF